MTYRVELISRRWLTEQVFELVFTRPEGLDYEPGHHIRFCHGGTDRDYTPVSIATDDTLRICVKKVRHPKFTAHLSQCPEGEAFELTGPHGHFLYHPSEIPAVFVATGTGIAPFAAYARSGVTGYTMLQGATTASELVYRDLLEAGSKTFIPCLSRDENDGQGFNGRVTEYLDTRLPEGKYHFYLCGRREMIGDAMDIIDERFPDSRIFTERFT